MSLSDLPEGAPGISPDLLQVIFDNMSDGVVVLNSRGRIDNCNLAMGVLVERPLHEIVGHTAEEAWGGRAWSGENTLLSTSARDTITRPDGSRREVSIRVFPFPGASEFTIVVYRDVTRQQREFDDMFRFLVENVNDGLLISKGEDILYANKRLSQMLGYQEEELLEIPRSHLRHSDARLTCSDLSLETIMRRQDGSELQVETEMTSGRFRGESVVFEIIRDISQRKRQERRANAFLELGRKLNRVSTPREAALAIVQLADELIGWDACFIDLLDPYDNLNLIPALYMDIVDNKRQEVEPPSRTATSGVTSLQIIAKGAKLVLRTHDSEQETYNVFGNTSRPSMSMMFVPIGTGVEVVGVMSIQSYTPNAYNDDDLSVLQALGDHCSSALARTRAQAELHESELRYRQMFQKSGAVKLLVDPESGAILDANASACSYYGFTLDRLKQMSLYHLSLAPPDVVIQEMSLALNEEANTYESQQRRTGGRICDVEIHASPITVRNRRLLHMIIQDVTERRNAQQRSQEFADLGRHLSAATSCTQAARIVVDAADRLIGWDACFVDLFASDVQKTVRGANLLVPILYCDIIDGKRTDVAPVDLLLPSESITYKVLEEGSKLILRERNHDITFMAFGDRTRASSSLMYVPINGTNGPVGVLSIQSYRYQEYDEEDLALLQLIADHCGGAFERTRTEDQLRLLESAVRNASDMVIITVADPSSDTGSRIVYVNESFEKITGYSRDEVIGKGTRILQGHDTDSSTLAQMRDALLANRPITVELVNYRKDGSRYDIEFSAFPIADAEGKNHYFVSVQRDITERKLAEQQLIYKAFHDGLTGLPNRNLFRERIQHAIARSQRCDETFAVLFLDLDNFKIINDANGHLVGDEVLITVARRLEICVRPGDTVARLGGDEFTILLEGIASISDATTVADRILEVLSKPVIAGDISMRISASVGMAPYASFYNDPDEIVRDADQALYVAKSRGKACYAIFEARKIS